MITLGGIINNPDIMENTGNAMVEGLKNSLILDQVSPPKTNRFFKFTRFPLRFAGGLFRTVPETIIGFPTRDNFIFQLARNSGHGSVGLNIGIQIVLFLTVLSIKLACFYFAFRILLFFARKATNLIFHLFGITTNNIKNSSLLDAPDQIQTNNLKQHRNNYQTDSCPSSEEKVSQKSISKMFLCAT